MSRKLSPCRICGSKNILAKWISETGEKWAVCDSCGNMSNPTIKGDPLTIWNDEQKSLKED